MRSIGRLLRVLIPVVLLVSIGLFVASRFLRGPEAPRYEVMSVRRSDLVRQVLASGIVNPLHTLEIGTQVSGPVKELYADANSPVRKGQLLALIDPEALESQLLQAEANLALENALLLRTDVQLRQDEINLDKVKVLFEGGANVAQSDLEAAETSLNLTRAQRKAQEARVAQCEAALRAARYNLAHTGIRSPIDGVVLSRNVEVEQNVGGNSRTAVLFVLSSPLARMKLDTTISEADIGLLKVGQDVSFTVDAYPDRVFSGKIGKIDLGPTIKQNVVYYAVVANIDNTELLLRPGMTADVRIQTASRKGALVVPFFLVKQQDQMRYIEVLDGKEVRRKKVTTGLKGGDGLVEVLSGLQEGEKLALPPERK